VTIDLHPWAHAIDSLREQAWQRLIRGVHDRHAPARHPTLATVSPDGMPSVRTVVLRGADPHSAKLDIHTHLHSAKITDLRSRPVAALHVWDSGQTLQIRLQAHVEMLTGPQAAAAWVRVPESARTAYNAQAPGTPIAEALAYDRHPDPAAFVVLHLHIQTMDLLYLGAPHRRALYTRSDLWKGQWVAP
jgi:pyridoxamine 5'-phosphate oxidase